MAEERIINITDFSALDTGPGGIANSYLKDGDHHICRCHNCKIPLCDVWVTQPTLKMKSKVSAICPTCKEKSLEIRVVGKFHLGATDKCNIIDMKYDFEDDNGTGYINQILVVETKLK
jgi:hypothetical protein